MQVAELVSKFSFTGSLAPLTNLNQGLSSAIGSLAKVATITAGVGLAVGAFAGKILVSANAQVQLAKETKIGIEAIQELGYVASVSGSSADKMESSLKNLSKKIGETAQTGSADFSRLGISVRDSFGQVKTADVILNEVSQSFKRLGLSSQEQAGFLSKLGIDESLLQTLQLSSVEMQKLQEKARALGVVTEADAKRINSFNISLSTLKYGVSSVSKSFALALAPAMESVANSFTDLLIENKDFIKNGLNSLVSGLSSGVGVITNFGKFLYKLVDGTIGADNAIKLLGVGLAVLNRAFLLSPLGLIVGAITAVALVIDDLTVAMEGGKSAIADWFSEWFGLDIVDLINDIAAAFRTVKEYISSIFNESSELIKLYNYKDIDPITGKETFTAKEGTMRAEQDFNQIFNYSPPATQAVVQNVQNNNVQIEVKTDNPQMAGFQVSSEVRDMLINTNQYFLKGGQ